MEMFNGMFGKVASGMCRLSMNGGIAVKTSGGYKTYDLKTNKLTNCSNFVFNVGEEFFFVIPTNKVNPGDIINYEDSTVQDLLPERHVFMGNTYFYGKIVSMFGNDFGNGKVGMNKLMSYMMLSEIMKGSGGNAVSGGLGNMNMMLPFMLMNGGSGFSGILDGIFDFDSEDGDGGAESADTDVEGADE